MKKHFFDFFSRIDNMGIYPIIDDMEVNGCLTLSVPGNVPPNYLGYIWSDVRNYSDILSEFQNEGSSIIRLFWDSLYPIPREMIQKILVETLRSQNMKFFLSDQEIYIIVDSQELILRTQIKSFPPPP